MLMEPNLGRTGSAVEKPEVIRRLKPLPLKESIDLASDALLAQQQDDGHWVYELEADCTIPAEYILMMHFVGEVDEALEQRIAVYLRENQDEHDGWSLYQGGVFDLSCSVKAYYALKLVGDDPNEEHMVRARNAILNHGGAAHANVFTRITLALFGQVPWRATPFIPAEVILLAQMVPIPYQQGFLLVHEPLWYRCLSLSTLKPEAVNPKGVDIRELFTIAPEDETNYFRVTTPLSRESFCCSTTLASWLKNWCHASFATSLSASVNSGSSPV